MLERGMLPIAVPLGIAASPSSFVLGSFVLTIAFICARAGVPRGGRIGDRRSHMVLCERVWANEGLRRSMHNNSRLY